LRSHPFGDLVRLAPERAPGALHAAPAAVIRQHLVQPVRQVPERRLDVAERRVELAAYVCMSHGVPRKHDADWPLMQVPCQPRPRLREAQTRRRPRANIAALAEKMTRDVTGTRFSPRP